MDPLQWLLEKKPLETHLQEIESLRLSLTGTSASYHSLWQAHVEKQTLLKSINVMGDIKLLADVEKLCNIMLKAIQAMLLMGNEGMIKKIILEGAEHLHEIQPWIWWESHGQRNPYEVEYGKRALWAIVKDEQRMQEFLLRAQAMMKPLFDEVAKILNEVANIQQHQARDCRGYVWKDQEIYAQSETNLLSDLQPLLARMINGILSLSRATKGLATEEMRFKGDILQGAAQQASARSRVKVMMVHRITGSSEDFKELQRFLESKGYLVYNIRLPGHGVTIEEDFNTNFYEWEPFLKNAMKYFYGYQKPKTSEGESANVPWWHNAGRFYIIGVSMGAIQTVNILSQSREGKDPHTGKKTLLYPYQSLVKGIIPMGTAIFPTAVAWAGPLRRPIHWLASRPSLSRLANKFAFKGVSKSFGDEAVEKVQQEMQKEGKNIQDFFPEFQMRVKEIMRPNFLKDAKNRNRRFLNTRLPPGGFASNKESIEGEILRRHPELGRKTIDEKDIVSPAELEQEADESVAIALERFRQGRRTIGTGTVIDQRSLFQSEVTQFLFVKKFFPLLKMMYGLKEGVKHIKIPSLIIHGLHDGLAHYDSAVHMYNQFLTELPKGLSGNEMPEKTILLLKKTGHLPIMEAEKQIVFEEIFQFIERTERWDAGVRIRKIEEQRTQWKAQTKGILATANVADQSEEPALVR